MNPLMKNMTPEQLRNVMSQRAPRPPQINLATYDVLYCECGNAEMEQHTDALIKIDPLVKSQYAVATRTLNRCKACKKYPVYKDGEWIWVEGMPPLLPPEPKVVEE